MRPAPSDTMPAPRPGPCRSSGRRRPWRPAPRPAPTLALPAVLASVLALAGCGTSKQDAFPPPCPSVRILPGAGDLTRSPSGGRDLTDVALQGRITGVSGDCKLSGRDTEQVDVSIQAALTRGPAGAPVAQVPYFVAVSEGDRILNKQVMTATARFGDNGDRVQLTLGPTELQLSVSAGKSAAAYTVWVGFQLTPDELAHNREAGSR